MKIRAFFLTIIAVFTLAIVGCTEDIDMSDRYVFTEQTIGDYLQKHEQYSEFYRLLGEINLSNLSKTTPRQLLLARGHFTVFAPTNDAIQLYLDSLYRKGILNDPSWDGFPDEFTLDSIRQAIVKNSIIDSGDDHECYYTWDFPTTQDAEIPYPNMYDRKLVVHRIGDRILINNCLMDDRNCDIPLSNGSLHAMNDVVVPSNQTLGRWLGENTREKREGFYVSSLLVQAVGLQDSLDATEDEAYRRLYESGLVSDWDGNLDKNVPAHRYYGFTFFAEPDEVWSKALGKPALEITVDDVMDYLTKCNAYPEAKRNKDYKSEDNLLNQFVTYHLLNRRLQTDRLVMHYNEYGYDITTKELGCAFWEYYTTMGKRRLVKIYESKESNGIYLNRCPVLDNGRHGTYHEESCPPGREGIRVGTTNLEGDNNLRNALVYPIEKILLYDEETSDNLGRERIRYDAAALTPELTNNDYRMSPLNTTMRAAPDEIYQYFDDMSLSQTSIYGYAPAYLYGWGNYNGDEVNIWGVQDVTCRLMPVPRQDTYEIRFECSNAAKERGMFQVYFGTDPNNLTAVGIPLDLRMGGETFVHTGLPSHMGWEVDTEDDDYNAEVDKKLRNNGFMKAPNIFHSGLPGSASMAREKSFLTRRIMVRQYMEPGKTYYMRFKSCLELSSQLVMDFFELCPKAVYDNPNTPEDIW